MSHMRASDYIELPALPDIPALAERMREVAEADTYDADAVLDAARAFAAGYSALLVRVRLAELVLYRAGLLAEDMAAEIANGKKRRSGPPSPEGIANMVTRFVRDYVDPIIGPLREAVGYPEGGASEGWYLPAEDLRAKLIGSERAADQERRARIRSEGGV